MYRQVERLMQHWTETPPRAHPASSTRPSWETPSKVEKWWTILDWNGIQIACSSTKRSAGPHTELRAGQSADLSLVPDRWKPYEKHLGELEKLSGTTTVERHSFRAVPDQPPSTWPWQAVIATVRRSRRRERYSTESPWELQVRRATRSPSGQMSGSPQ